MSNFSAPKEFFIIDINRKLFLIDEEYHRTKFTSNKESLSSTTEAFGIEANKSITILTLQ
ncbi:MAG TPA: hypothetical protein VK250_06265 [Nitrososphaeraceae archaeon]|nr:hypothetical protein [Nitrososphaeraceae archaeon]